MSMIKRVIAKRPVMGWWRPQDGTAIYEARARFDAGVCELVQRRDGDWFVLIEIIRKHRCPPRDYFKALERFERQAEASRSYQQRHGGTA